MTECCQPLVSDYYCRQAADNGLAATATMPDEVVISAEVGAILRFLGKAAQDADRVRLLEVGCGNGHLAGAIHETFGERFRYQGIDATAEMVRLAQSRGLPCRFSHGSVLDLPFDDGAVDLVVSERVIINILDPDAQYAAFRELARVSRRGALAILIEGFKDGLANLNRARADFLLEPIPEPEVNNWFTEERWTRMLSTGFIELQGEELTGMSPPNFLSSHYFMTRFLHDVIRPQGAKLRNTEFAKFFAQALPPIGDYSPLRLKYLRRN